MTYNPWTDPYVDPEHLLRQLEAILPSPMEPPSPTPATLIAVRLLQLHTLQLIAIQDIANRIERIADQIERH